jgi:hypothetical protein
MTEEVETGGKTFNPADLLPSDFYEYLLVMISMCANEAWIYMGLVENPKSKTITKDLTQARLAIDVAAFLLQKLEEAGKASNQKELRELIANLQLNFVEKAKE